ncbi:MAG: ribokinase [Candidatus Neomarinimicrobiota bacterium]|nr:ribokinase [Candidatus Neomarinimicrobiota bacterium]RKY49503.1 MAG: ribokinase [Candidatus Neomarinimicrobiota bacterium]
MGENKIVVVGSSNTDMVIKVKNLPKPGETVIGKEFYIAAGGKGANQAVAAARLGADVTFIAKVGKDMFGDRAIANFQESGINTDFVFRDEKNPSGVALIFVDEKGENSIAVSPGSNANLVKENIKLAIDEIKKAVIMLIQLEIPIETVEYAVNVAKQHNVKVILNPAPARKLGDQLLKRVDIITPNESEAEVLTGLKIVDDISAAKAAEALIQKGVGNVVITLGERGAFLYTKSDNMLIPTKRVNAVDTTAAGDAFNGGLAFALGSGMSLKDAIHFANFVGAYSVTRRGAQPSMPNYDEVKRFMSDN